MQQTFGLGLKLARIVLRIDPLDSEANSAGAGLALLYGLCK